MEGVFRSMPCGNSAALRILGMSAGVSSCHLFSGRLGVSLGGSGVSITRVKIVRVCFFLNRGIRHVKAVTVL